jgi:hypothetical protein
MKVRSYIELPLTVFRVLFPEQAEQIPQFLDNDPCYIVRYDYNRGLIELGYREDNWLVS